MIEGRGPLAFSRDGRFFRRGNERCLIRGITYGPFAGGLNGGDATQRDLDHMVSTGCNAIRVFERPSAAFLSACAERDLGVFVSLRWESNTDFSGKEEAVRERLLEDVVALREEPSISGYFIGNEVPATVVRWMGWKRVRAFLEGVFDLLEERDPNRLLAYANYPSTEYLQPRRGDFTAYNLYLEEREPARRYLRRLHHLAEDRPLVISEYGLDSLRHGEEKQAESLAWLTEEIFESGAAGAFLFSYTDDWFNGGRQVTDWAFGIVSADRSPKPSAAGVAQVWQRYSGNARALDLVAPLPLVTVIVCTHNGHRYLPACLASLSRARYEAVEVIVVDDGSRPGIDTMVAEHPEMRYVRQDHAGLSAARNRGAEEGSGEILAFIDDDCEADPDWLSYLVREFRQQGVDACGGPNLAPEAGNMMERCIQLAPGNPTHVMLDDFEAEHLPGCNLAVTREAFSAVGGFAEHYRVAGDDVDFCWRLQFERRRLGFAPNAVVWHHRRKTWYGFIRQQMGYGRAEALLHWDHPQKYSGNGGTDWKGTVYTPTAMRTAGRPVIYFGRDGTAPFQAIYNTREGREPLVSSMVKSSSWLGVMLVAFVLGFGLPSAWWVAASMLLMSWGTALHAAWKVSLPPETNAWRERLTLAWLHWSPGLARQLVRWLNAGPFQWHRSLWEIRSAFWNEEGIGREIVLAKVREKLAEGQPMPARNRSNQWAPFDVILSPTFFAHVTLTTVTENHDGAERLTRLSVKAFLKRHVLALLVLSAAWLAGQLVAAHWWIAGLGTAGWIILLLGIHWHTKRQLSRRNAILGSVAADVGLKRMDS